jgi:hypothetical protein
MNTTRLQTTTTEEAAAVDLLLAVGLIRIADEACEYITTYRADDDIDVMIAETAAAFIAFRGTVAQKERDRERERIGIDATAKCFPLTGQEEPGLMVIRMDDLYSIIKGLYIL